MWLTRAARGQGVGRAAVTAVLQKAIELGATSVCAETTVGNAGALAVLESLGFELGPVDDNGGVHAARTMEAAGHLPSG